MTDIDYDLAYSLFITSAPRLARLNRQAVVALATFIGATARAKHGSIVIRATKSIRTGTKMRLAIMTTLEYVAHELDLQFGQEIGQMALMLVCSMYDSQSEENKLRATYPSWLAMREGMPDLCCARALVENSINVGLPDFTDPMAQAVAYISLKRSRALPFVLKPIVADYLWAPTNSHSLVYTKIHAALLATPFLRWASIKFADKKVCAEDIIIRLRAERPDLLQSTIEIPKPLHWRSATVIVSEVDEYLEWHDPSLPIRQQIYTSKFALPGTIAKAWGLISGRRTAPLKTKPTKMNSTHET